MIDTADAYQGNEETIGRWLAKDPSLRQKVFLVTKLGFFFDENGARGRGDVCLCVSIDGTC
jgi:aryl-alcohol dehydrogenase-like predicted oxidoreductase